MVVLNKELMIEMLEKDIAQYEEEAKSAASRGWFEKALKKHTEAEAVKMILFTVKQGDYDVERASVDD